MAKRKRIIKTYQDKFDNHDASILLKIDRQYTRDESIQWLIDKNQEMLSIIHSLAKQRDQLMDGIDSMKEKYQEKLSHYKDYDNNIRKETLYANQQEKIKRLKERIRRQEVRNETIKLRDCVKEYADKYDDYDMLFKHKIILIEQIDKL